MLEKLPTYVKVSIIGAIIIYGLYTLNLLPDFSVKSELTLPPILDPSGQSANPQSDNNGILNLQKLITDEDNPQPIPIPQQQSNGAKLQDNTGSTQAVQENVLPKVGNNCSVKIEKKGDTVYALARKVYGLTGLTFNTKMTQIAELNKDNNSVPDINNVEVGDVIIIPCP